MDDFCGASRDGVFWIVGRLLDVLGLALGFPMDGAKSLDCALLMDVFCIEVALTWNLSRILRSQEESDGTSMVGFMI